MNDSNDETHEAGSEVAVPVVAEQVEIGKRAVAGRTVTVRTIPVTERQAISQPLASEEVTVERVPIGRVIEAVPEVREEDDLTVIPVVEERITVTKELVLKEEIHLRRTRTVRTEEQEVELTRTEVEIT